MSFVKTAMVVTVGSVLSCCVLGGIGAMLSGPNAGPSAGVAAAPSASGNTAVVPPAAAPAPPLSDAELAALLTAAEEKATDAASMLERRKYVDAARLLDAAMGPLARVPEGRAANERVAVVRAKAVAVEQGLGTLLAPARTIAHAEDAMDLDRNDVVARYDAMLAARNALPPVENAPDELATALARTRRDLDRAIARDEDAAFEARLDRRIRDEGLIRIGARTLADQFRTNEVNAENAYKGRRLAVDGIVAEVRTDAFGDAIVGLKTSNMFMPVDAETTREVAGRLQRGDRALLACDCKGMVIGRPQLDGCELLAVWR